MHKASNGVVGQISCDNRGQESVSQLALIKQNLAVRDRCFLYYNHLTPRTSPSRQYVVLLYKVLIKQ